MKPAWEVIYQYDPGSPTETMAVIRPKNRKGFSARIASLSLRQIAGIALVSLSLGGIIGPLIPSIRLESGYWSQRAAAAIRAPFTKKPNIKELPPATPVIVNPLVSPDGSSIAPVNTDFSVIIPKIGVNAPVIADVDPTRRSGYDAALLAGVAHAATSFTPDQSGTTYLFSHSTNYDWFIKDLNAVFYLLKNLKTDDTVVVYYKGVQYTYRIVETKIVNPREISYLVPTYGQKNLILETCWPPGATTERLLVFADLIQAQ